MGTKIIQGNLNVTGGLTVSGTSNLTTVSGVVTFASGAKSSVAPTANNDLVTKEYVVTLINSLTTSSY